VGHKTRNEDKQNKNKPEKTKQITTLAIKNRKSIDTINVGHKTRNEDKQNKYKMEKTKQMNNTGNTE
jgi:Zn ribbon nucleic-acid-binding protein